MTGKRCQWGVIALSCFSLVLGIEGCKSKKAQIAPAESAPPATSGAAPSKVDLSLLLAGMPSPVYAPLLQTSGLSVSLQKYGANYHTLKIIFSNTPISTRPEETKADYGKVKICREDGSCFKMCATCSDEIQSSSFEDEFVLPNSFLQKTAETLSISATSCVMPERRKKADRTDASVDEKNPECGAWQQTKFLYPQNQDATLEALFLQKQQLALDRQNMAFSLVDGAKAYLQTPSAQSGLSLAGTTSDSVTQDQSLYVVAKNMQAGSGMFMALVQQGLLETAYQQWKNQTPPTTSTPLALADTTVPGVLATSSAEETTNSDFGVSINYEIVVQGQNLVSTSWNLLSTDHTTWAFTPISTKPNAYTIKDPTGKCLTIPFFSGNQSLSPKDCEFQLYSQLPGSTGISAIGTDGKQYFIVAVKKAYSSDINSVCAMPGIIDQNTGLVTGGPGGETVDGQDYITTQTYSSWDIHTPVPGSVLEGLAIGLIVAGAITTLVFAVNTHDTIKAWKNEVVERKGAISRGEADKVIVVETNDINLGKNSKIEVVKKFESTVPDEKKLSTLNEKVATARKSAGSSIAVSVVFAGMLVVGALMQSGKIGLADTTPSPFHDLLQAKGAAYVANKSEDASLDQKIQLYLQPQPPH